jgi:type VI secretion system protein VasD
MHSNAASKPSSRRAVLCAAAAVAVTALPGCSSSPAVLTADIVVGAGVNPDVRKRPSPVVVRIFELKAPAQFESADFVSLFEKDQAVLGGDLIGREEMVLRPGENKTLTKTLSPDTKFIGVMAGFREIERARWRAVVPVRAGKKNPVTITLNDITLEAKAAPKSFFSF